MKKIVILSTLFLFVAFGFAQNDKAKSDKKPAAAATNYTGAEIKFDKTTLDLGTVKLNQEVTDTYTFTNVGKKPLLLYNVVAACNCTKVEYSKSPVMPGQKGSIKVIFSATKPDDVGQRTKRVTVDSNAESDRVILTLKANVVLE